MRHQIDKWVDSETDPAVLLPAVLHSGICSLGDWMGGIYALDHLFYRGGFMDSEYPARHLDGGSFATTSNPNRFNRRAVKAFSKFHAVD